MVNYAGLEEMAKFVVKISQTFRIFVLEIQIINFDYLN